MVDRGAVGEFQIPAQFIETDAWLGLYPAQDTAPGEVTHHLLLAEAGVERKQKGDKLVLTELGYGQYEKMPPELLRCLR